MGYYTRYELSIDGAADSDRIHEEVIAESGYSNPFEDECKWYDHEAHIKNVSARHPGVIFTLHGEGEESGDIWKKYFLNGKVQVAKAEIIIAGFDESLLK